jgi:hypothetical protein
MGSREVGPEFPAGLTGVLESAARLQEVVPEAVLVGGSAAALYAGHRTSFDHDHVLPDLVDRYQLVLEAFEATEGWATNLRVSKPPFTLLGTLGGIEAGVRQLRRTRPLEVAEVQLPSGAVLRAPTLAETLRVKSYLVVQRNHVRDYLDVAALADHVGVTEAAAVLGTIDEFYTDRSGESDGVATALVERLAHPTPRDVRVLEQLPRYKALRRRWHDWEEVRAVCTSLAADLVELARSGA